MIDTCPVIASSAARTLIDPVTRFSGAAFLYRYVIFAFRSAYRGDGILNAAEREAPSWRAAVFT